MRQIVVKVVSWLVLAAGLVSNAYCQQVWKWVDKNGVTHYSDQPAPGATRVDLHVQTYDSAAGAIPTDQPKRNSQPVAQTYQSVRVTQPTNDETIVGTGGTVSATVEISPGLQMRHRVLLTLDGQQVAAPSSTTSFQLSEVPRGTHVLVASVVGDSGELIFRGDAVQFHVRQATVRPTK